MQRIIAYVDGFNLYYGLRSMGWRRLYWLDVHRLAENLLKPGQPLVRVHYFTARIASRPGNEGTRKRQGTYLDALETLDGCATSLRPLPRKDPAVPAMSREVGDFRGEDD